MTTPATNIDTAQPSYLASNLGTLVNPVFQGGTLTMNVAAASYSQGFTLDSSGTNTIDQNDNVSTFSGVFSDAADGTPGSIIIANSGTDGAVIFTGSNTYTGVTTIGPRAVLALSGDGSIAASSGLIDDGTFDISTTNAGASIATLSGGGVVALGTQTLTLTDARGTFSGTIGGSGGLTVSGGIETLSGTNTYTGGTTISQGTLYLGGQGEGATLGTLGSGPVLNNAALVFTEPSTVTFSNVISGTGTVTQSGPGTITLNGTNTYNGLTEVSAGMLIVGDSAGNGASVGGSVQVDTGATLAGYGSLGVGTSGTTLTNNGTVIPGGASGNAVGTLTETGSYVQGSGGNLLIAVTPTQASQLRVGGTSLLAGTVTFAYAPGTYVPITYTVLESTGAITGRFGTVSEQGSVPTSLTRTVQYVSGAEDPQVNLVLSSPGTPPTPTVVAPLDGSLFSEQLAARTAFADARVNTLLLGGIGDNDCTATAITSVPGQPGAPATASAGIAALGRALCGAGGWIRADGTFLGANGSATTPGYHASTAGFLAGIDRPVGDFGLRLGIAVGYDHDWLHDGAGGSGTVDVARFGVYAIQTAGRLLLNGAFLYGHDWTATTRPTGVGAATAQYGGNEVSGGLQASLPLPVSGFTITPVAGFRFASVGAGSFVESTGGPVAGFGVSGAGTTQLSAIPYARVVLSSDFVTASGIAVSPYATVGYQYQAGDAETPVLLTAADGTTFRAGSSSLDRSAASLGVGLAAGQGNWTVFAGYGALVAGNWTAQQVTGGVKIMF